MPAYTIPIAKSLFRMKKNKKKYTCYKIDIVQ